MANSRENSEGQKIGDPEADFSGTYPGSQPVPQKKLPTTVPKPLTNSQQIKNARAAEQKASEPMIPTKIIVADEHKDLAIRSLRAAKATLEGSLPAVQEQPPLPFEDQPPDSGSDQA